MATGGFFAASTTPAGKHPQATDLAHGIHMRSISHLASERVFNCGRLARRTGAVCRHTEPPRNGSGKSIATPLRIEFRVTHRKESDIIFSNRNRNGVSPSAIIPTIAYDIFAPRAGKRFTAKAATHTQINRKLFSNQQSQGNAFSIRSTLGTSHYLTQIGATPR